MYNLVEVPDVFLVVVSDLYFGGGANSTSISERKCFINIFLELSNVLFDEDIIFIQPTKI